MSISELSGRVRKELLEFAWSQWAQMGLSAHTSRTDRWAMDPEALILFTTEVARRDPRLFDEMLDWLARSGRLLSLQRLRNLVPRFPSDRRLLDAVVAWAAESAPPLRWPKIGQRATLGDAKAQPLFHPDVLSFVAEPDPVFARHGYLRPRADPSGRSTDPDVHTPIGLAFRLRLFFGPGTRSEVVRVLLTVTDGPLDATRIADEAGFAKRNVNETLTALVGSGGVKARWSGNERVFLARRDKWATLLEIGPSVDRMPTFVSWVHLLPSLVEVLLWLEAETEAGDSEYLASSRARDLVDRIALDLQIVGLTPPSDRSLLGADYLPAFVELVESQLKVIGRHR